MSRAADAADLLGGTLLVLVLVLVLWRRAGSFFTVEQYRPQLEALHDRVVADGPFVA